MTSHNTDVRTSRNTALAGTRCCRRLNPDSWIALAFVVWVSSAAAQTPLWIWNPAKISDTLFVRKKFHIHNRVRSAEIRVCADDGARVFLNGIEVLPPKSGRMVQHKDVTSRLRLGRNVLAIRVDRTGGERGLIALLTATLTTGKQQIIATDFSWKTSESETAGWRSVDFDDSNWPKARSIAPHGAPPWGPILSR